MPGKRERSCQYRFSKTYQTFRLCLSQWSGACAGAGWHFAEAVYVCGYERLPRDQFEGIGNLKKLVWVQDRSNRRAFSLLWLFLYCTRVYWLVLQWLTPLCNPSPHTPLLVVFTPKDPGLQPMWDILSRSTMTVHTLQGI
jgi:hypothetical protein